MALLLSRLSLLSRRLLRAAAFASDEDSTVPFGERSPDFLLVRGVWGTERASSDEELSEATEDDGLLSIVPRREGASLAPDCCSRRLALASLECPPHEGPALLSVRAGSSGSKTGTFLRRETGEFVRALCSHR